MDTFKAWLAAERGRSKRLAEHLKVPQSFVSNMASGEKPVPVEHGAAIELFTDGAFSRREYWPESYGRIWPELAGGAERLAVEHGIQVAQPMPGVSQGGEVAHA